MINTSRPVEESLQDLLSSPEGSRLSDLLRLWKSRIPGTVTDTPETCTELCEYLISIGEYLVAYDIATKGISNWTSDIRLKQLRAIALSRSGATLKALDIFLNLEATGNADSETIGMLGSIYKDLWFREKNKKTATEYLQQALHYYKQAYDHPGGYWPGINAATISLILGDAAEAARLARPFPKRVS